MFTRLFRSGIFACGVLSMVSGASPSLAQSSHACVPDHREFNYRDRPYTFRMPFGCTRLTVKAWGGGSGSFALEPGRGGSFVEATFQATPGEYFRVVVGAAGEGLPPPGDADPDLLGEGSVAPQATSGGDSLVHRGETLLVRAVGGGANGNGTPRTPYVADTGTWVLLWPNDGVLPGFSGDPDRREAGDGGLEGGAGTNGRALLIYE